MKNCIVCFLALVAFLVVSCGGGEQKSEEKMMDSYADPGEPVPGAEVYIEEEPNDEAESSMMEEDSPEAGDPVPGTEVYVEEESGDLDATDE